MEDAAGITGEYEVKIHKGESDKMQQCIKILLF
jgi:hypothetical protein